MDLSKYTLNECIKFLDNEGYNQYRTDNNTGDLSIITVNNNNLIFNAQKYADYGYFLERFPTLDALLTELNIYLFTNTFSTIAIFNKNDNITRQYIKNKNYYVEYGYKPINQKDVCNSCYKQIPAYNLTPVQCNFCLKKYCGTCCHILIECKCRCELKTCDTCKDIQFLKCCNKYYYSLHVSKCKNHI